MNAPPPLPSVPCPRCGRTSARAFDATGVCVSCAGAQIFSQTIAEKTGSAPPFAFGDNTHRPARIGPYTIISELGRGGMGAVYLAQHAQLGRIVALKVIPSRGSATSDLELRFLREARTIARLSHPHIVTVHDAGHDRGHAYFSMDYFEDGDLARRLRAKPFSPREAATLLHGVAAAIAHSHAAGVLHRDLKPSNILLADGAPHVADFGLATELDSSGGLTAGTAVIGTPHYLAPEALSHGSAAQGVASDLYSLGVILHEMLTGRTPFAGASPAELPGLLARADAPALSVLAPQVPRDLATICAKCIEFDPARRYATAADLAEDLRRWLAGEPIKARPVSAGSRLLRWARRRPALAATWLLSGLLVAGIFIAALSLDHARRRVVAEAATSAALAEFLQNDLLGQAAPDHQTDRALKMRTVLDRAAARIPGRFPSQPLAEATVRLALAATYHSLGEYAVEESLLRPALVLRTRELGAEHPDALLAAIPLVDCLTELGRFDEAGRLATICVASLRRTLGPDHRESLRALDSLVAIEVSRGRLTIADPLALQALERTRRTLGPDAEETRLALNNLASLRWAENRLPEAEALNREALANALALLGPEHPETLDTRSNLGTIFASAGRFAEAEQLHREVLEVRRRLLSPEHPQTLRSIGNLAFACMNDGKLPEAVSLYETLVATRRRVLSAEHPDTLLAMHNLAQALGRTGQLDAAVALVREAAGTADRTLGPENLSTLTYRTTLAGMLLTAKRFPEALPLANENYATARRVLGPDNPRTLNAGEFVAGALNLLGRHAEAEPVWREVADTWQRAHPDDWHTAMARGQLGKTLAAEGRSDEAEPLLRESYTVLQARLATLPANRRKFPSVLADQLATIYAAQGKPDEAAAWRAKAVPPAN